MSKGVSLNELAKFVLVEYIKESAEAKEDNTSPLPLECNMTHSVAFRDAE
jgi:hypothetical protein